MSNRDAIRWHCPDRDCQWTVVAIPDAQQDLQEPRCICGRTMQRADVIPAFHYLDFLREEEVDRNDTGADKE
jgi:hypothetical protein